MFNLASRGSFFIACEQALLAGRENEGELIATTSLEFEFHPQFPCGSPSTELSDFCQSAQSGNEHECKQTLKNMPLLCHVISANQYFTLTFSVQIFKFQKRSCKLSFLFPPHHQVAPESLLTGYLFHDKFLSAKSSLY